MSYIVKNSGRFSPTILARGQRYFLSGQVANLVRNSNMVVAEVRGSRRYTVECVFEGEKLKSYHCNCPYDFGGPCKHVAAVLFALDHRPLDSENRSEATQPKSGTSYHLDQAKSIVRGMYFTRSEKTLLSHYGYFAEDPVLAKDFWVFAFGEVLNGGSYALRRLLLNFAELAGLLKPSESLLVEAMSKAFQLHRGGLDAYRVLDLLTFGGKRCLIPLQKALSGLPISDFLVSGYDPGFPSNVFDSLIPEIYPLVFVLFPSARRKLLDSAMDRVDIESFARMFLFYVQSGAFDPRYLHYLQAHDADLTAIYSAMFDLCYKAHSLSYYLEIRDYIPRYFPKSDLAAVDKKIQSKFEQLIKRSKASPELTSALMELTDLKWPYLAKYLSDERLLSKRGQGCSLDQGLAYAYVKTGRPEALGLKRIELEGKDAD